MLEKIKEIRELTGAGVVEVKKALDEAGGDQEKALEILRLKGLQKADKKGSRQAGEGAIFSYVHTSGKTAALVKLYCETDFVARNEEFCQLGRDLAMQVVAMSPLAVRPEEISQEELDKQIVFWQKELEEMNKPEAIKIKILQGKKEKFCQENSLLGQSFIKDPQKKVEELVKEKIAKLGENIQIGGFFKMDM